MKFRFPVSLLVAAAPAIAAADTITHSVPFDYDAGFGVTFPVVHGFDTLGGTRQLNAVTFDFHHNFSLELFFESTGPTPLAAGDFLLDFAYLTLFQLGEGGGEGEGPPIFGPGAYFVDDITGDLAAYDGVPGNDGPDSFRRSFTDAFTISQAYDAANPEVLEAVTDVGALTTVFGGFNELFFEWVNDPNWPIPPGGVPEYPTDAALWVSWPNFRHFGTIDITYDFTVIPEPAVAAPLAVAALLMLRRR
ncbi:MAG: hypothetical protein IT450_11705 [Phycisphaerales bacterium]|nr:hypothetical protein [Phycisphaerales bacterium]